MGLGLETVRRASNATSHMGPFPETVQPVTALSAAISADRLPAYFGPGFYAHGWLSRNAMPGYPFGRRIRPMDTSFWDFVTRFILPPVLGGAGGFLTIFANWGIDKRKHRLQRRRELITGWRLELIPMVASSQDSPEIWAGPKQAKVLSSPFYASLRPHLSQGAVKKIEDPTMGLVLNRGGASPSNATGPIDFPSRFSLMRLRGSNVSGNWSNSSQSQARSMHHRRPRRAVAYV
jgi:hypothetical protein